MRRMTVMIPVLGRKHVGYRRGKAPDPGAFLDRYRSNLAALTAERQPEIDALLHKLDGRIRPSPGSGQNFDICVS